jgi:hypothetical protein
VGEIELGDAPIFGEINPARPVTIYYTVCWHTSGAALKLSIFSDAAAEIETLRTQNEAMSPDNERLRAALTEIAQLAVNDSLWFAEIARAALKESK